MNFESDKLGTVAEISYLDGDFEINRPGTHVMCAVTGKPVRLEMLRYWSVARQEAYIDAASALQAHRGALAQLSSDKADTNNESTTP